MYFVVYNKLEIFNLFCRRLLFQLRVYFVVHNKSEIFDLFCRRLLFQLSVHFVVYNNSEISDILYISVKFYCGLAPKRGITN